MTATINSTNSVLMTGSAIISWRRGTYPRLVHFASDNRERERENIYYVLIVVSVIQER